MPATRTMAHPAGRSWASRGAGFCSVDLTAAPLGPSEAQHFAAYRQSPARVRTPRQRTTAEPRFGLAAQVRLPSPAHTGTAVIPAPGTRQHHNEEQHPDKGRADAQQQLDGRDHSRASIGNHQNPPPSGRSRQQARKLRPHHSRAMRFPVTSQ